MNRFEEWITDMSGLQAVLTLVAIFGGTALVIGVGLGLALRTLMGA